VRLAAFVDEKKQKDSWRLFSPRCTDGSLFVKLPLSERKNEERSMGEEQPRAVKGQMITLMQAGHSWQEASTMAGSQISRSTAYRLLQKVRTQREADLHDGRHGHPSKVLPPVLNWLELRCQTTSLVASSQLQKELQEQLGVLISVSHLNAVRARHGWSNAASQVEKNPTGEEATIQEGAGGLLLLAAAQETGLLSDLETAIALCEPTTPRSLLSSSPQCLRQLMQTLLFLPLGGLRRTHDLRGYTGDVLGVLTGRHRAYGYCHTERFLSQFAKAEGAEALTTALGSWTTHLWEKGLQEKAAPCFYIDGHRKPVYVDSLIPRGLIGRTGKILGGRALALLHDDLGHPLLAMTARGDQHLTVGLPKVLARYEQSGGKTAQARIIVDREGMSAPFLRDLVEAGRTIVTLLKTNQYDGLTSFAEVGEFVPLMHDHKGQVTREVAPASFALPLPDQKGQILPLQVALIRDLRRQVPCTPPEEDPNEDLGLPPWWRETWQAEPAKAEPTTAKLIPIVTTAPHINAMELAQTYIRRWPLQENVIRDYLLPLGLDTNQPSPSGGGA
jgi:transposase